MSASKLTPLIVGRIQLLLECCNEGLIFFVGWRLPSVPCHIGLSEGQHTINMVAWLIQVASKESPRLRRARVQSSSEKVKFCPLDSREVYWFPQAGTGWKTESKPLGHRWAAQDLAKVTSTRADRKPLGVNAAGGLWKLVGRGSLQGTYFLLLRYFVPKSDP